MALAGQGISFSSSSLWWRRLHSLAGVFLVLYLILHLFTNSQAALLFGQDGGGFIYEVNAIHHLPYLIFIEILLLGVPFAIHMLWGVVRLWSAESNAGASDGTTPALVYGRNYAYRWQRLTSWFLLIAVSAHVIHMRLVEYPSQAKVGDQTYYVQRLETDPGLYSVAARLGVRLLDQPGLELTLQGEGPAIIPPPAPLPTPPSEQVSRALKEQYQRQQEAWRQALTARPLRPGDVLAVTRDFGTATLLLVRNSFKDPWMALAYTVFVLAACYHAFNGLWTSTLTWGVALSESAQRKSLKICYALMFFVIFLGLVAIWGTYWINLKT